MTVENNDIFQFLNNNGFKQKTWKVSKNTYAFDYSQNYNIRNEYRQYHYKRLMVEFDFEYLNIYNGYKKIFSCKLSDKPGWGNNSAFNYLPIPEPVLYFIQHKEFKQKEKTRYIPTKIRLFIFSLFNYKCNLCGADSNLEVDHIYPFSKGGSNNKNNLQLLCKPCNRKKFNKIP